MPKQQGTKLDGVLDQLGQIPMSSEARTALAQAEAINRLAIAVERLAEAAQRACEADERANLTVAK